jgi:hypothetical protein
LTLNFPKKKIAKNRIKITKNGPNYVIFIYKKPHNFRYHLARLGHVTSGRILVLGDDDAFGVAVALSGLAAEVGVAVAGWQWCQSIAEISAVRMVVESMYGCGCGGGSGRFCGSIVF